MSEPIKPADVPATLWPELADDFRAYQDSLMRGEKAPQAEKVLIAAVATQVREMIASALDEAGESIHASSPDTRIAIARHATFEMAAGIARTWPGSTDAAHVLIQE